MKLGAPIWSSCICAALAVSAVPAAAGRNPRTLQGEANGIFKQIQWDADEAYYRADRLQSFAQDLQMDWYANAAELDYLKSDVNDMEAKLGCLEAMRQSLAPWQQHAIDEIAATARQMVDNTQDAIVYGNTHRGELWLAPYRTNVNNLINQAKSLERSVDSAVEFANVSQEYRDLEHKIGD